MISEVVIKDPTQTCVPWWGKVEWLKGRERIEFKPGLNILWGPNGSGKSTILTLIARMLHCEQGGRTCVTKDSVQTVFRVPDRDMRNGTASVTMADGALPVHDGQCVLHFNPEHAVGLMGGMAGFDYDFTHLGVMNAMFRGSSGETVMQRLNTALDAVVKAKVPDIEWKVPQPKKKPKAKKEDPTTAWAPWDEQAWDIHTFLKGTLDKGPPTILFDEPDRSISLKLQAGLWQNFAWRYAANVQVIAASHSPLALRLPGVNDIETSPGYLAECEEVVDRFLGGKR